MNKKNIEDEFLEIERILREKDFSKNSNKEAVYHKTLENIKKYKGDKSMKNKFKRHGKTIAASFAVLCIMSVSLMQTTFGADVGEKIKSIISLKHIGAIQVESSKEEKYPIPKEFKGKVFDKNGKAIEFFPKGEKIYTSEGEEIADLSNNEIITVAEQEKMEKEQTLIVKDESALSQYTCFKVTLPSYLPEDYVFDRAEFYKDEKGIVKNSKYMNVYFANKKTGKEIFMQQRFADEETGYEFAGEDKIEKIKINDVDAILIGEGTIDWEYNGVLYGLHGRKAGIGKKELIKIAESIQ